MILSLALAVTYSLPPDQIRIVVICVLVALPVLFAWLCIDAEITLRRIKGRPRDEAPPIVPKELDWEKLATVANDVVERTISQFAPELRKEAEELGWSWFKWSLDIGANNLLGHFWGSSRNRAGGGSAAIILYLGNISEYCEKYGLEFEDQVRTTYLHELGHYLGLNESELEERGLR